MDPILNLSEYVLLEYLSAHSAGRGERTALDPKAVARGLRVADAQFEADVTTLTALGFTGSRRFRPVGDSVRATARSAVWITGTGENFLKRRHFEIRRAASVVDQP